MFIEEYGYQYVDESTGIVYYIFKPDTASYYYVIEKNTGLDCVTYDVYLRTIKDAMNYAAKVSPFVERRVLDSDKTQHIHCGICHTYVRVGRNVRIAPKAKAKGDADKINANISSANGIVQGVAHHHDA